MATTVIMPKQGLQMTEGMITRWLVREGQPVEAGAPLFIMETDKLSIEIMASASGILLQILRQEGETVPITEPIALIGDPGEAVAGPPRIFATPRARSLAAEQAIELGSLTGSGPEGLIVERDVQTRLAAMPAPPRVTPLAAKLAAQHDVPLAAVTGTGNRGKITRADVEVSLAARTAAPADPAAAEHAPAPAAGSPLIPLTGMRKAIAERMKLSLQEMAQANHRLKVDMSEVVRLREQFKAAGIKVSYTDLLIKVVARALADFPILNATLTPEGIRLNPEVNIGVAVALDDGLVVPVLTGANRLALRDIATAAEMLITRARQGLLQPDDLRGGTFTITNLGMFDIDEFTAIINPPESAILAVGKIEKTPVVRADAVVIRPIMTLSLTYDHRIIDGAPAARFLQRIKQLLQEPLLLL